MVSKALIAASTKPMILSILLNGENYGYQIIQSVKRISGGTLEWSDGMLYPVLHRLDLGDRLAQHPFPLFATQPLGARAGGLHVLLVALDHVQIQVQLSQEPGDQVCPALELGGWRDRLLESPQEADAHTPGVDFGGVEGHGLERVGLIDDAVVGDHEVIASPGPVQVLDVIVGDALGADAGWHGAVVGL